MKPEALTQARLHDALTQCERHWHHLSHALRSIGPQLPMDAVRVAVLDDESVQDWDQFVLRFSRLQDTMGAKLLPAVLDQLQEPYEDRPMIDKLNRLERLGYLRDAGLWQRLRAIRNRFSHDYPQDDALKAAYLNEGVAAATDLREILDRVHLLVATLGVKGKPPAIG